MKRPHLAAAIMMVAIICAASVPQTAARTEIPNAVQPQLTIGTDGIVWLAYAEAEDVFVVRSADDGESFSRPLKVANVPHLNLGMHRGPRVAAHGDRLTVTVIADALLAFTSLDGGKSWSAPITVNEVQGSAREGLHDLACGPEGQVFVAWLDLRNGSMELWGAASTDGGRTWGKNECVFRSPEKSICECCHPSALYDGDGTLAVMWRNAIDGSRDMWLTTRPKNAAQFTSARKLGEGTWKLDACPMDGGRIIAVGGGKFWSVWQRAGEIFLGKDTGPEINLGPGKQPVAMIRPGWTLVVWQQGSDLVFVRDLLGSSPLKYATNARFPTLVTLANGKGAVIAYEHLLESGRASADNGDSKKHGAVHSHQPRNPSSVVIDRL